MKPDLCYGCPLENLSEGFARLEGTGSVALIGEALGHEEAVDGLPFRPHAVSGSLLERAIRDLGKDRQKDFRIFNILQCQPPQNQLRGMPWERDAIAYCDRHRRARFEGAKIAVALGDTAFRTLVPSSRSLEEARGFRFQSSYGVEVIPTYHPRFIRQGNMHLYPLLVHDIAAAFREPEELEQVEMVFSCSIDDLRELYRFLVNNPKEVLACDIETDTSIYIAEDEIDHQRLGNRIVSIQFYAGSTAYYVEWNDYYMEAIRQILSTRNVKVGHNFWFFDAIVLARNNIAVKGHIHDTMIMYKAVHPELPRSLQAVAAWYGFPFPWKHLRGTATYGCYDVVATRWVYFKILDELRSLNLLGNSRDLTGYVGQYYVMHPIIQRIPERGIPIDLRQFNELGKHLRDEYARIVESMQSLVPPELLNLKPKRKDGTVGYIRPPKETQVDLPVEEIERRTGLRYVNGRWAKPMPFVPSKDQVIRYIRYKGYRVPQGYKKDETTSRKELEPLAEQTGDELLRLVLEARSYQKLLSNDLPNWRPSSDGRVHALIRYGPPTGQLQASAPNILNAAKHNRAGQLFRRIIAAPEGMYMLEFDYRRFHVMTLAWEAQCADYLRFAELDCHSIFTSWIYSGVPDIELSWSEDDIKAAINEYKKLPDFVRIRNTQAKHCVLANNNGVGPRKLYYIAKPGISSVAEAERLQAILAERFPKVEAWKRRIVEEAYQNKRLTNVWGYSREFWDVYSRKFDKRYACWRPKVGSQWNEAISFNIQATAFGMLKHKLYTLHRLGLDERYNLINTIHDSFIFMVEDPEQAIADIRPVLEAPCTKLVSEVTPKGLMVRTDVSYGRNLAARTEDNPEGMGPAD